MSIRIMTLVWEIDLPDSQKIVLLALADNANDEGWCWPSVATLCRKCSKGERTIQGVVKALAEAGHLTRYEQPGKGVRYRIHPRRDCAPADTAPRNDRAPQARRDTPAEVAGHPRSGCGLTIIEPSENLSAEAGAGAPLSAIDVTKVIFDTGIRVLMDADHDQRSARQILGRWRKQYSDSQVLAALSRCEVERPTDPVGWLTKTLQREANHHDRQSSGNDEIQNTRVRAVARRQAAREAERAAPERRQAGSWS